VIQAKQKTTNKNLWSATELNRVKCSVVVMTVITDIL